MWEENRKTTGSCQITFSHKQNNQTFPLHILKRINKVNSELIKRGLRGLTVCGDKITFGVCGNADRYVLTSYKNSDVFKNIIVTNMYEDKGRIISGMCAIIILWNEGYIDNVSVELKSKENMELWQTAWSILLGMKEV